MLRSLWACTGCRYGGCWKLLTEDERVMVGLNLSRIYYYYFPDKLSITIYSRYFADTWQCIYLACIVFSRSLMFLTNIYDLGQLLSLKWLVSHLWSSSHDWSSDIHSELVSVAPNYSLNVVCFHFDVVYVVCCILFFFVNCHWVITSFLKLLVLGAK